MNLQENLPNKKKKKWFSKKFIFLLILINCFFFISWIFLDYWQDVQGGNTNFIHESVGLFLCFGAIIGAYFGIYRQQESIKNAKIEKIRTEREAINQKAKIKLVSAIEGLKSPEIEKKEKSIEILSEIGITVPEQRQVCINALAGLNNWMLEYKNTLIRENLILWRLNHKPFNNLKISADKQELSLKAIIAAEKIIKQHAIDFAKERTQTPLDLSAKCFPALNLGFTKFPANSVLFNFGFFWEISFWESSLEEINFDSAELQRANFWKSQLTNVNFENTKLKDAKLKTDLTNVKNLNAIQFFNTSDWSLNKLSEEQINLYFPEKTYQNAHWEQWSLNVAEREKMFK